MIGEKISLCCITGNCEGIISKFIEQFRPLVDEICIVRAIGNQKHDGTLRKALAAGCRVGEYFNGKNPAIPSTIWPHVDDFGAARNVAWEMASHEWVMWADIDDDITEESIKEFRRLVDGAPIGVEMIRCPYIVPDQGIHENIRERIVRRGKFTWIMPVHECLKEVDGHKYQYIETRKAVITHGAKSDRRPSCERNIRILEAIPENERAAGTYFYLFSEYYGLGRQKDAIEIAKKFMKMPGAGEVEKYEVLLVLSTLAHELSPDDAPAQMASLLHEAHMTCPDRAEALYELSNLQLTFGNIGRAQAYCRQMRALPKPEQNAWNIRGRFYGWAGAQLVSQVERLAQRPAHADALEYNRFKAAGGKISLLHATRGRPLQASRARLTWLETTKNPDAIEHIFAIDADDEHSECLKRFKHVVVSGEGGCVEAWNVAAHAAHGDVLIQLSDDWVPPWHWDEAILGRIGPPDASTVLAVNDGHRTDKLLCMAILTRKRWEQQGKVLFHPDFLGLYSDNWFSERAYKDGVVIEARDLEFTHCHPLFGTAENDETYLRQNSGERHVHGQRILNQLHNAEGRTIHTHCSVRLGDNLTHLQFLRKLACRYPNTRFVHAAHSNYLPELCEVVADVTNIELRGFHYEGEWREIEPPEKSSIEAWKNHEGFWANHPDKNDFCAFYVDFFNHLARKMGLENPIKRPEHFLFDYPALIKKTPLDGPFDFLIINSPPMSGQLAGYSDMSMLIQRIAERGHKVITTERVEGIPCTQDYNMTVTDIGGLSRHCRFIIMVATGPSWPTFNVFNQTTIGLRIILLDNEKINMTPNTVHVQDEACVLAILNKAGLV